MPATLSADAAEDRVTAPPSPLPAAEAGASQSVKAQLRLREMILAGALPDRKSTRLNSSH